MKIFEMVSSRMVRTNPPYEFDGNQRNEKGNDSSGNARRPETADINRAFHNLIEYEPVACLKKTMAAKTAARAQGVYVREVSEEIHAFHNLGSFLFWELLEHFPYRLGPHYFGLHQPSPFLAVFSAQAAFYFFVRHNASRSNILIRSLHHFLKGGIGFDLIEAGLHISESHESFANDAAAVAAAVLCEVIENLFAAFIEDKLVTHWSLQRCRVAPPMRHFNTHHERS